MIYILWISMGFLAVGLLLSLLAISRGPTSMERSVGLDVVTACLIGLLLIVTSLTGLLDLVPMVVVMAAVGFVGTTTIARFSQPEHATQLNDDATGTFSFLDDNADPVHDDALDDDGEEFVDDPGQEDADVH